jgi:hypothetical protein
MVGNTEEMGKIERSKEPKRTSYEYGKLKHKLLQRVVKREESSRRKNCKNGPNAFGLVAVGNNWNSFGMEHSYAPVYRWSMIFRMPKQKLERVFGCGLI